MSKRIALVGHCGIDGPRLESAIVSALDDVQVIQCRSDDELSDLCKNGADLLLFNREMTYGFNESSGIDAIRRTHSDHPDLRCMLISDYPEAQQEAVEAGALPGFGKADIGSPRIGDVISQALA